MCRECTVQDTLAAYNRSRVTTQTRETGIAKEFPPLQQPILVPVDSNRLTRLDLRDSSVIRLRNHMHVRYLVLALGTTPSKTLVRTDTFCPGWPTCARVSSARPSVNDMDATSLESINWVLKGSVNRHLLQALRPRDTVDWTTEVPPKTHLPERFRPGSVADWLVEVPPER